MCQFYLWYHFLSWVNVESINRWQDSVFLALTVGTAMKKMKWLGNTLLKQNAAMFADIEFDPFPHLSMFIYSLFLCVSLSLSLLLPPCLFSGKVLFPIVSRAALFVIPKKFDGIHQLISSITAYSCVVMMTTHTHIHILYTRVCIWICLSSSQKLWHGCANDLCHCGVSAVVQLSDVYLFSGLFIWQQRSASEEVRSVCLCALE